MPVRAQRGRNELGIEIDPAEFSQLVKDVKAFDANLAKALRKNIRSAAEVGKKDVQRRLMGRTFKTDVGLAAGLAAGTKVSIRTGAKTAGVSIVTTGVKLPGNKQAMVQAFNKPSFRHPVFGHSDRWVTQKGRPYFGFVLDKNKADITKAIEAAMKEAGDTIQAAEVSN